MSFGNETPGSHGTVRVAFMPFDSDGDVQAAIDAQVATGAAAASAASDSADAAALSASAASDAQGAAEAAQASAEAAEATIAGAVAGGVADAEAYTDNAITNNTLGLQRIEALLDLVTTPAQEWPVGITLPAEHILIHADVILTDTITGAGGAVKLALGTAANAVEIGRSADLAASTDIQAFPNDWSGTVGEQELKLIAVNTSGAPTGTIGGGVVGTERVRVRVIYFVIQTGP